MDVEVAAERALQSGQQVGERRALGVFGRRLLDSYFSIMTSRSRRSCSA